MANLRRHKTKESEQYIQNQSFDEDFGVLAVESLAYDPTSGELKRVTTQSLGAYGTNNVEEASATTTYVGKEDADGNWIVQKIDTSSGTSITYATKLNNPSYTTYSGAWTNRTNLSYDLFGGAF